MFLSIFQFLQHWARNRLFSAAERRGTPVLLSASVSDNFGNSPQMAAPRRSREIDQSTQRFHVGWFHVGWQGIGNQSDAVTQNAWFRCAICAAILYIESIYVLVIYLLVI